jgi:hypothetical protein
MRFPDRENALFDQLIMHCELYIMHYSFIIPPQLPGIC